MAMDKEALSGIERSVYDAGASISEKMGEKAVLLFRTADGKLTLTQIADELNLSTREVQDLLSKLEGKFVHVEFTEEKKEEVVTRAEPTQVPVDLPRKSSIDPVTHLSIELELAAKFGPSARGMFQMIDGKKDVIDIATELSIPISYVDEVLFYISGFGVLKFHRLTTEDIKKKYGTYGVGIYNQHGRNGLLLFRLLEKYPPVTAIKALDIDALEAIVIYETIYKILSPPYPLNSKQILAKLLGKA
jgi:DNA-binding Lrp family transcriptional regulator